jgi:LysR family transcriptional regulator, transcriptional activator of the cysJI operon
MNLNQLKLFYFTAKFQSPSIAARYLFISQPAVTTGIQRFENHYNVKLFKREGRTLSLTAAGQALYEHAEQLFDKELMAEACIQNFQNHGEKNIRILSSETFGAYYLPTLINDFYQSNPDTHITLDIMLTDQVIENTLNRENDIGFISYPVENDKLVIKEVFTDRLVIIVRKDHPFAHKKNIKPEALRGQSIISHEESSAIREALNRFTSNSGIEMVKPVEFTNNEAIKRMVEMGVGMAFISLEVVRKEIERGELIAIPLSDPCIARKFYMIYHKNKYIPKIMQTLFDMTKKWANERNQMMTEE